MVVTADKQVRLDLYDYLELLCRANVTDAGQWPEGTQQGAALLARIREIETDCRNAHGEWDWELISKELQDEYDITTSRLDLLIEQHNPDQHLYSEEEVFGDLDQDEVA